MNEILMSSGRTAWTPCPSEAFASALCTAEVTLIEDLGTVVEVVTMTITPAAWGDCVSMDTFRVRNTSASALVVQLKEAGARKVYVRE